MQEITLLREHSCSEIRTEDSLTTLVLCEEKCSQKNGCVRTKQVLKYIYFKRRTQRHREVLQFLQIALLTETRTEISNSSTHAFTYSCIFLSSYIDGGTPVPTAMN